jgi:hypothetical protein
VQALSVAQDELRREVNPTVLTPAQVARKLKEKDSFVAQVWTKPRLWIIGGDEDAKQ